MQTVSNHIPEDVLERYSMGLVGDEEAAPVEEHLLVCVDCQDRLQTTDEFVLAMRQASLVMLNQGPGWWQRWRVRFAGIWEGWKPVYAIGVAAAALTIAVLFLPRQTAGPPAPTEVVLQSARGLEDAGLATAAVNRPLRLVVDLTAIPNASGYRVEIVDAAGGAVWSGQGESEPGRLVVEANRGLGAGRYWVRLYGLPEPARLLREFGLEAR